MKKTTFLVLTALSVGTIIQGCGNSQKDSKETADSANEAKIDSSLVDSVATATTTPAGEADSKFAVDAAEGGMAEVELGQLAEQKAMSADVKAFGLMMVKDHSKANEELTALAQRNGITLPTALGEANQKHKDELSAKNGSDFDKAYIDLMIEDHKKDVKLFEDARQKVADPDIKAFVVKTLPTLKAHLSHIEGIEKAKK